MKADPQIATSIKIKEICASKQITTHQCAVIQGIRKGTYKDVEELRREITKPQCYAFSLIVELSVEEAKDFFECAGHPLSSTNELDKLFIKQLKVKNYGLLSFVSDAINLLERQNRIRIKQGLPEKSIPKFYKQEGITDITYKDCLDKYKRFNFKTGKKLLDQQPIK